MTAHLLLVAVQVATAPPLVRSDFDLARLRPADACDRRGSGAGAGAGEIVVCARRRDRDRLVPLAPDFGDKPLMAETRLFGAVGADVHVEEGHLGQVGAPRVMVRLKLPF